MTTLRSIDEQDVEAVARLYREVYGDEYPFKQFYDATWIKRGVFDPEIRWFVVEDGDRLLGSAAIMLNAGDADDLVSEIGRLVVHPEAQGRGLASQLIDAVTAASNELSDFAFAECRTAHLGSQIIFGRKGYHVVGIEPLAYKINGYESVVFVCRLSETARRLRRGSPVVIPAAYELASRALTACGIAPDVAAAPREVPYPVARRGDGLELAPMDTRHLYRVLKLSRHHFLNPEVFGAFRLEYGHLKLVSHQARYLILRRGDVVLGGLGYTWDETQSKVDLFELVAVDDRAKGTLIDWGIGHIEATHDPRYLAIDVSAHATRMQASLHLLGFAPVVYAPSMVYVMGERFDVLRLVKLRQEPKLDGWLLLDEVGPLAELTERAVLDSARGLVVDKVVRSVRIFDGLTDVQLGEVAARCREASYQAGEQVFAEGSREQALFVVLEGLVDIVREGEAAVVARLGAGQVFGEMALLEAVPRSAGARAREQSRLLVMRPEAFDELAQTDAEAALVVVRNLAEVLSRRLRRVDEGALLR